MKYLFMGMVLTVSAFSVSAAERFSVELLLGGSKQNSSASASSTSGSDSSVGVRASMVFMPHLAVEFAYHDFGETDDKRTDGFGDTLRDRVSSEAADLGVKAFISPYDNDFTLYGRIGLSSWAAEFEATDSGFPGQVFNNDDDGVDLYYGVGFHYQMSPSWYTGLEYRLLNTEVRHKGSDVDHEITTIAFTVGTQF